MVISGAVLLIQILQTLLVSNHIFSTKIDNLLFLLKCNSNFNCVVCSNFEDRRIKDHQSSDPLNP